MLDWGSLQEATDLDLKTTPSDALFARSTSDQNLPVTGSPAGDSQHGSEAYSRLSLGRSVSYLSKLESLASSAVRSADKVGAKLIIVYTQTGRHPCNPSLAAPEACREVALDGIDSALS